MATAMTDSNHRAGTGNHHLLQVTGHASRLPFPTSPALPDRRARLKRLNLQIASREKEENYEDEPSKPSQGEVTGASFDARRVSTSSHDVISGDDDEDDPEVLRRRRLPYVNKRDDVNGEIGRHRNIVRSKQQRRRSKDTTNFSDRKRDRRRHNSRDERETDERLRLPSIHVRDSRDIPEPEEPSSPHQDFFLTAVAGFEELPALAERKSSLTSKTSKEDRTSSSSMSDAGDKTGGKPTTTPENGDSLEVKPSGNDVAEESLAKPDPGSDNRRAPRPLDHSPVQSTPREHPPTSRIPVAVKSRDTKGLQRVYLEGLDYMRGHVSKIEEEVHQINRDFHKVQTDSQDDFIYYLKECDERLLQANNELRKHDIKLKVIDSDTRLVKLLNDLRSLKEPDKGLVDFLTRFWEECKATTDQLQSVLVKFNNTVLQRLSNNYISSNSADLQVPISQQYALDIEELLKDVDSQLSDAKILVSSFGNGIHHELMDSSEFSDKLMVTCDLKAFPILGFVSAACVKIIKMCQTARRWLGRDETFMHEINTFIKETRSVARRREQVLQTEKQKQKRYEKNVKIAKSMLHNNMEKLQMIEHQLGALESKLTESKEEQKSKSEERQQKETMVDFLKLTLQQTKKNYILQSKRSKLLRQVQDLGDYLKVMETELEVVQDQIMAKSHEKILLTEKIQSSEQSYGALKTDLDKFSDNLEKLESDVTGLTGQLLQLEIIHTIKTSPETLDNLLDRPSTVKLSQSLKERIKERKKKAGIKAAS